MSNSKEIIQIFAISVYAAIHNLEGEAMNFTKFLASAVACGVLVAGATGFDTLFAENIFHDSDIKISRGFGRVKATGKTHGSFDGVGCGYNPFKQNGFSADHRLTLTEDADLQFIVEAEEKDPVFFILSREEKLYCIQKRDDNLEEFDNTSISNWHDMPAGTYLIWVGDHDRRANNYVLTINEE